MIKEERLDLADIQGVIIPGFKKDYSALIALRIQNLPACKTWLKARAPEIARADEVLAFNRLHKQMRARRRNETLAPKAVWVSMSFSADGLSRLRSPDEIANAFVSEHNVFRRGMFQSSLGDADPAHWLIGGSADTVPHILLVVAADKAGDLAAEVARLKETIAPAGPAAGTSGVQLMGEPQFGATLPGSLRGHEHFGFKDGISQPAIRGLASKGKEDFIDARLLAPSDPIFDLYAEPGRPLVWPGQFVLGYNRQSSLELTKPAPPFKPKVAWQRNGSYLVYRRLQQKVHLFWRFCTDQAERLSQKTQTNIGPEAFATLLVGRWPSGAPLLRTPAKDDPDLAGDDNANNDFLFSEPTPAVTLRDGTMAGARFTAATPDPDGKVCPFAAHVRKVNPRDDPTDTSGPRQTKVHLTLRRGIPYGPAKDHEHLLENDGIDRGLLFMSYQASIEEQFEFLMKDWVNRDDAPHDSNPRAGQDPVIAQTAGRRFVLVHDEQIDLPQEPWIVMTGGGYFFTPSISALSGALAE